MEKVVLSFFWEGVPPRSTFQQRGRNFAPTPSARLARAVLKAALEPYAPKTPFTGVLGLRAVFTWPHTKETEKASGGLPVRKTTRPDGVNLMKGLEDIMTSLGFWKDDNLLAVETVERWNGPFSGIYIEIREFHS